MDFITFYQYTIGKILEINPAAIKVSLERSSFGRHWTEKFERLKIEDNLFVINCYFVQLFLKLGLDREF